MDDTDFACRIPEARKAQCLFERSGKVTTPQQYRAAYVADTCINCERCITFLRKVWRLFWAPIFCNTSIYWKVSCSYKCWGEVLEREIKEMTSKIEDSWNEAQS